MVKHISWKKDILPTIIDQLSIHKMNNMPMTLRGMFYILVSLNKLENLRTRYDYLSSFTAKLREEDILEIDCFVDNGRYITDIDDEYETVDDYIRRGINHIENATIGYTIPRWYGQPHYIEVWVEKATQRSILHSIINVTGGREVRIVPAGGQESVTYAWDNAQRLKQKQREGKQVHIRYFGDLDPSGEQIEQSIIDKIMLEPYSVEDIDFKRVGVTNEQKLEYGLIPNTDPETMRKLLKDTNRHAFIKKYGHLFQIEVDALQVLKPDEFKKMVLGCIDEFFDNDIYYSTINHIDIKPTRLQTVERSIIQVKGLLANLEGQRIFYQKRDEEDGRF